MNAETMATEPAEIAEAKDTASDSPLARFCNKLTLTAIAPSTSGFPVEIPSFHAAKFTANSMAASCTTA